MKKILCGIFSVVLSIVCLLPFVSCKPDENTLYVYTAAGFPSYEYVNEKGEVVGVDIDLMKEVGKRLNYKVRIYDVAFNSVFLKVQKHKNAVGAAGITVNEERQKSGLFSITYSTSIQYVIAKKGTYKAEDLVDGKISKQQLAGKKIGVQLSTTGNYLIESLVANELKGTGAECFEYKNALVAYDNIGTRLDCFVLDKLPAEKIVKNNSSLECFSLDEKPESYALYLNKNATELKEKIDVVLQELIEEGFIEQLIIEHSEGV